MIKHNLDNETYHSGGELSASGLKVLKKSPLHYWERFINPNRKPVKPSSAMAFGSAVHCAVLEPGEFDNRYTVIPDGLDRRTKEGKEAYRLIEESGKLPLSQNDFDCILALGHAVHGNKIMQDLFMAFEKLIESSIYFMRGGVMCRIRPDFCIPPCHEYPNGLIMDLKTTQDASDEFTKSIYNYGYYLQAEFYQSGFMAHYETTTPPPFIFLAVESDAPFAHAFYELSDDVLEYAMLENDGLIELYRGCKESNTWHGYSSDKIEVLETPYWMQKKIDLVLLGDESDVELKFIGDDNE